MINLVDLHCDLLCYLEKCPSRTPFDPEVRCSLPQLSEGGVKVQVMAVFCETAKGSSVKGKRQMALFKELPLKGSGVQALLAIENGSSLVDEEEPLGEAFSQINTLIEEGIAPCYIGMTWNQENRFGGGAETSIGLKADGRSLLEFLNEKSIAIDISHASDRLAEEILDEIDRRGWRIPLLASHSNARAVYPVPRNLPDPLIKEVIARGGLIGINYVTRIAGEGREPQMARHIAHILSLGGENALAIGSDFFYSDDFAEALKIKKEETFYPDIQHAAHHQRALQHYRESGLSEETLHAIAYKNALRFMQSLSPG